MAKQEEQLDETQWRAPILVEQFRGINGDNVHRYFMESPFFDRTSNNWALAVQEARNNSMLIYDRRAFEAAVQTRFSSGGLEFMTTDEPQSDQGAWIVTKQERAKRPGAQDRVTVLGTYIIVGDVIIQAPSVIDVVGNRLLSITDSIHKFFHLAASLPLYHPATGHTYLPPTSRSSARKHVPTATTSSRAETPLADSDPSTAPPPPSQTSTTAPADPSPGSRAPTNARATDASLLDSLALSARYASEFVDENPLTGEPGTFVFSATTARVAAQQQLLQQAKVRAAEAAAKASSAAPAGAVAATQGAAKEQEGGAGAGAGKGGGMRIDTSAAGLKRGGSVGEGKARSPTSGGPGSGGLGKIKRRKSRAVLSPKTGSPKEVGGS